MRLPDNTEVDKEGMIHLQGINLEDTWLLAMNFDKAQKTLTLKVDLSIWPESKYYRTPTPGEWTCYRKADIGLINSPTEYFTVIPKICKLDSHPPPRVPREFLFSL
jgi:hypothetical protein